MQQRRHSWQISVSAHSKNFQFRIKAMQVPPTWRSHRCSILLKLRSFLFDLRSDSFPSHHPQRPNRTLKSRFLAAVERLRRRRCVKKQKQPAFTAGAKEKNPDVEFSFDRIKHLAFEEPLSTGSLLTGILGFMFQSIVEKDHHRGIIILGSAFFLSSVFALIKKNFPGKSWTVPGFTVAGIAFCLAVLGFDRLVNHDHQFIMNLWNKINLLQHLLQ